jgi:hypothetical protein
VLFELVQGRMRDTQIVVSGESEPQARSRGERYKTWGRDIAAAFPRRFPEYFQQLNAARRYFFSNGVSPALVMTGAASGDDRKRSSAIAASGCCASFGNTPTK